MKQSTWAQRVKLSSLAVLGIFLLVLTLKWTQSVSTPFCSVGSVVINSC